MYNYQQFVKDQRIRQKSQSLQRSFIKQASQRKNKNFVMTSHHKKRLNAFLLSAIQTPIQIDQYRNKEYEPRKLVSSTSHSNLHKNQRSFRLNAHTTDERLEDLHEKSRFYDGVPFNNASNHKFRQFSQSNLTKPFKLSASSTGTRLYDSLLKNRTNQVDFYRSQKLQKMIQKIPESQFASASDHERFNNLMRNGKVNRQRKPRQKKKQIMYKTLMPTLHRKTYFQSLKNMLVDRETRKTDQGSLKVDQNQSKRQKQNGHMKKDSKQKQNYTDNEQFNRTHSLRSNKNKGNLNSSTKYQVIGLKQSAKQALIRCKLMKKVGRKGVSTEAQCQYGRLYSCVQ